MYTDKEYEEFVTIPAKEKVGVEIVSLYRVTVFDKELAKYGGSIGAETLHPIQAKSKDEAKKSFGVRTTVEMLIKRGAKIENIEIVIEEMGSYEL